MASLAPEPVDIGLSLNRNEGALNAAPDPAFRALEIGTNYRIEPIQARTRELRLLKLRLGFRLAFLQVRYFVAKTNGALLFGLCRLIGEPPKPSVKSGNHVPPLF